MDNSTKSNAKAGLDKMKFEVAREIGVDLKQGYNGDLSSRDNGYVGGSSKIMQKGRITSTGI